MKSRPTIKTTSKSNSFLSTGPSIIQPMKGKRKIIQQNDNSIDLIRSSSKTNKQINENLSSLLETRNDLINQITRMEGELIRSHDLISNERQQLAIFGGDRMLDNSYSDENINQSMNNYYSYTNFNMSFQQSDKADVSTAIQNCLILQPFLKFLKDENQTCCPDESNNDLLNNQNEQNSITKSTEIPESCNDFRYFLLFLNSLEDESYSSFLKSSFSQIKWLSECNEIYQKVKTYVESKVFVEKFKSLTEQLFFARHEDITLFLYDPKMNEYISFTEESGFIQFSFETEKSILSTIIEKQIPEIVQSPPRHPSYSQHVDQIFNKRDQPFFAIPFGKFALVTIFRLDDPFNNEDLTVGKFYSTLMAPLFEMHVKNSFILMQSEYIKIIHAFEADLADKTTFDSLLPYILSILSTNVGANDANLFIVEDESFFTFDIDNDQISQKKYPRTGAPEFIVKRKKNIEIEKLNSETFERYDDRIDKWSEDKSFLGFPIISDNAVIAVLCVSDKEGSNKFNKWDVDFLQRISNDLSLVLPSCIKNEGSLNNGLNGCTLIDTFSATVQSFVFKTIEEKNSIEIISKTIQKLLNCEWLSIFLADDPTAEITRIVTLHDETVVDTNFLDLSFIKETFLNKKPINISEAKSLKNFKANNDISPGSFLFVLNDHDKEKKVGVFALNSKEENGRFNENSETVIEAVSGFIVYSIRVSNQSEEILNGKHSSMTMTNAFNVCESIINDKKPFEKLLTVLTELLSMEHFLVIRYNELKGLFDVVLHSEELTILRRKIESNDPLASQFSKMSDLTFINDFSTCSYQTSMIADFFPIFKQLIISKIDKKCQLVCIFAGRNAASNYKMLFKYFSPLLKIFYKTFSLNNEVEYVEIEELNKIDLYRSNSNDLKLTELDFDAESLSDGKKDVAVLMMFERLNLFKAIGTNVEQVASFLIKARHSYKSEVPFHNYKHALDSAQMMFLMLSQVNQPKINGNNDTKSDNKDEVTSDSKDKITRVNFGKSSDSKKEGNFTSKKSENSTEVRLNDNNAVFSPVQCASLMLAALLHDVSHEGFDSSFLKKTFSPYVFIFGPTSTLEHLHASTAVSLLQDFLIYERSGMNQNENFWTTLTESIIATDISQISDFLIAIQSISKSFDKKNDEHLMMLSKLLIQIANAARCFRPFDISKKFAQSLAEEKARQNEAALENQLKPDELKKVNESEISFIDSIVSPLVQALCEIDGNFVFLMERLKETRLSWSNLSE